MQPYEMGKGQPLQTREMMNNRIYHSDFRIDETYFPLIGSSNVQRYNLKTENSYIKYGKNLAAPRRFEIFTKPRILINRIFSKKTIDATYVEEIVINNTDIFNFIPKDEYAKYLKPIVAILTSNLCATYFKNSNVNLNRQVFPKLNVNNILEFPLPTILKDESLNYLSTQVDTIISFNRDLQTLSQQFQRSLKRKFNLEELPKKLQDWYLLSYSDFIKELAKKKVILSLQQEAEWESYFISEAQKLLALKAQMTATDKAIDNIVYALYDLSKEEIEIVEKG